MPKCIICPRRAAKRLCPNCQRVLRYWDEKPEIAVTGRIEYLSVATQRMEFFTTPTKRKETWPAKRKSGPERSTRSSRPPWRRGERPRKLPARQ